MQLLTDSPNKDFSLGYFAELFGCAKSSISEDLQVVRAAAETSGLGYVETTAGARGGVRYVPYIKPESAIEELRHYAEELQKPDRILGSGFIYTTDLMFSPGFTRAVAMQFARRFAAVDADMVVTVETKGIGVALRTAQMLNLPLVVIRREAKVSEGSTISINYFSGSADRIQKMSLSKRSVAPGSKGIIIDDFMRGGGSVVGMQDMLREFDAQCAGVGVVMVAGGRDNKKIGEYFPVYVLDESVSPWRVDINPDIVVQ